MAIPFPDMGKAHVVDTVRALLRSPGIPLLVSELPLFGFCVLILPAACTCEGPEACPSATGVPLPLQGSAQEFTFPALSQ